MLGLGKLGGLELNYSSDIDLIFLYDERRQDRRPAADRATIEFFDHLAREIVRLLTENDRVGQRLSRRSAAAARGPARADGHERRQRAALLRHPRPHLGAAGLHQGPARRRRPGAGPASFSNSSTPWIYRRYLSHADISGIKALKRRIEQRAHGDGADARDVKTGHGGIRDIEFVIQFLQLLNGGDLPELRTGNTLEAMAQLEHVRLPDEPGAVAPGRELHVSCGRSSTGCKSCSTCKRICCPSEHDELRKLAAADGLCRPPTSGRRWRRSWPTIASKTELNRKILDHLLHDAFSDDTADRRPRSIWCSIPIRRRSGSPRCWASTASAT